MFAGSQKGVHANTQIQGIIHLQHVGFLFTLVILELTDTTCSEAPVAPNSCIHMDPHGCQYLH